MLSSDTGNVSAYGNEGFQHELLTELTVQDLSRLNFQTLEQMKKTMFGQWETPKTDQRPNRNHCLDNVGPLKRCLDIGGQQKRCMDIEGPLKRCVGILRDP